MKIRSTLSTVFAICILSPACVLCAQAALDARDKGCAGQPTRTKI